MNRRPGKLADRLIELEKRRPSERGRFYLIWGKDKTECLSIMAEAKANGTIRCGDRYDTKIWPHSSSAPPSRWLALDQASDEELHTICELIGSPEEPGQPSSVLRQYSKAELSEFYAEGLPIL
jgi:hypothetical protein